MFMQTKHKWRAFLTKTEARELSVIEKQLREPEELALLRFKRGLIQNRATQRAIYAAGKARKGGRR